MTKYISFKLHLTIMFASNSRKRISYFIGRLGLPKFSTTLICFRDVNHFTAGPQCRTGNVSSKLDQTVNFYNSHIGSPVKVCFSRINDCSYVSSFSSCSTYTIPPSYLIITDTTGGGKLSLTVSNSKYYWKANS